MLEGDASSRDAPGTPRDPLSPKIHAWLRTFAKAMTGLRLYADNNAMLQRYLEEVHSGLEELFEEVSEFSLAVRDDHLIHRGDVVWRDDDRVEGLPFTLFRNAFRRLTFERGMEPQELQQLMRAIVADYSRYDALGDDLVAALWRLQLQHLRYVTIDTLTIASRQATSEADKQEIDQLQSDVESIVAMVYHAEASGDDIVSGLSISEEDLEALREVRSESAEDLDPLDHATERAITNIDPDELKAFKDDLAADGSEALVGRTMDLLVRLLFTERSGREARTSVDLLQQLMDQLLLGRRYTHATELIRRLRDAAEDARDLQKLHIARQLLRMFSAEQRILPLVATLNDRVASRSVSELVGFLRSLGEPAVPALLVSLEQVDAPLHRRIIRDLIVELGLPDVERLQSAMSGATWYVVRDLLVIASRHPAGSIAKLVRFALDHEHPRVREQAVKMLRPYAEGSADEQLRQRIDDPDPEVRATALRVAVLRRSRSAASRLRTVLSADDASTRDPKELRLMTHALVSIEGEDAVPALHRWLNPGLIAALKTTDLQVASAVALGQIRTEAALTALSKGSRSLVPKVRDACRRSLERLAREPGDSASMRFGDGTHDLPEELYASESGEYSQMTSNEAFEPAWASGDAPAVPAAELQVPPFDTPVESLDLPPAPPAEDSTDLVSRDDLKAAQALIRKEGAKEPTSPGSEPSTGEIDVLELPDLPDVTSDLIDEREKLPSGSYRVVIPDIDVIVPRADRTPTPHGSDGDSSG